jgi:hypothetical protein
LCESFGIEPKGRGRVYQKSYPNYYDQLPYPRGYRVPEFSKFNGDDGKTTLEYVGQFILECGEASTNDVLKLRMFSILLSDTAFTWFTSLAPNHLYLYKDDPLRVIESYSLNMQAIHIGNHFFSPLFIDET